MLKRTPYQVMTATVLELAEYHGLKRDGHTYDYSAILLTGTEAACDNMAEDLRLRGAEFGWTARNTLSVKGKVI